MIDSILIAVSRVSERFVDSVASVVYEVIKRVPPPPFLPRDLTENERRALAYAIVGDLIASPIPEPFDTPIDVVVQRKISELLPNMGKYRQMAMKIAEFMPILELLPNYTISVIAAIREARGGM